MVRTLASQLSSLALALVFAVVVWVVATNEANPERDAFFPEAIPLEFVNLGDQLVIYQRSVEAVRVRLQAPEERWRNLRASDLRARVNLVGRGAGVQQVPVQVEVLDPYVRLLSTTPAEVTVRLEKVGQAEVNIRVQVVDDPPVGFEIRTPTVTPAQILVRGPQVLVQQVYHGVAPVAIRGAKAPVEREATVTLQDDQGGIVAGLVTVPPTVTVQLPIVQKVGYKEVAIKPILQGNVAPGYWISNITVQPSTVTLVGAPDALGRIAGFVETQPIEVGDRSAFVIQRVNLVLPEGVSLLQETGDISVRISIDPQMGGQTVRRQVRLNGLGRGLTAELSPDSVEVILSGALPTLMNLTPNDVSPVVDLTNLAPGAYQLKPNAQLVPSGLRVESILPDTVEVTITAQ